MNIYTLDLAFLGNTDTIAAFLLESDGELALVECGPQSTIDALEKAVAAHGYQLKNIKKVFLSHIHFDHAGAAWVLANLGATIYVHPAGLKHLIDPTKLYNSAKMIYGDKMEYLWGTMEGIDESQLVAPEHGQSIVIGNEKITSWYTPGHAVHHIAWQLGEVLFTGDVAGVKIIGGPVVPPCPPPDINIEDWKKSIELMRNLPVKYLYLTHYGKITEISVHLDALENMLADWAAWMKPYAEAQTALPEITPLFQAYVKSYLESKGLDEKQLLRYESANPAWMSVAGLMRYWKLKLQ